MRTERLTAIVVGAGVGGLTAAIALRAQGAHVEIYEADVAPRVSGSGLGVLGGTRRILEGLGIDVDGISVGHRLDIVELRTQRGRLIRALPLRALSVNGPPTSIQRSQLVNVLRKAAGDCPVHYGAELARYDIADSKVTITCTDGRRATADILIGADGFRSAVRSQLAGVNPITEYGYVRWLAAIPYPEARSADGFVRHYWGAGQRFGIVDLGGGSAYWWGTQNMPVEHAREWRGGNAEVLAAFDGWPDEVLEAISDTPDELIGGVPAQDRPFLERWGSGPVTLIGDAAHPMLASSSLAAGSAIEDAFVLSKALHRAPDPIAALRRYEDTRREPARALVLRSRRLNRIEQIGNPLGRTARDLAVRYAPEALLRYAAISEFYPHSGEIRPGSY
ncbi:FAD-dependent monooxygenase [Antrihabitans sp. YC2-6]|uniref:FAD-dependent monooxygenase n=1 Tax=Antrihabitans sp. YC2-6 TaxID=2799498 RepID=UPI0018F6D69D|nr:FAD-dependent monooxygenase [Antrihabitans sp. YC2-6]MBJ8348093.1 FAD-dependent monooxygenase [Antrihabitans sp. YC2-6]